MTEEENGKVKIAAIGDLHIKSSSSGKWGDFFREVSREADVLALCGDLTDTGKIAEAKVLKEELKACSIPIVAVLGNHDFENDQHEEIIEMLTSENIFILYGDSIVIKGIGFAGAKGFAGGFDKYMLPNWGEKMNKNYVQESVNEALKLDRALAELDSHSSEPLIKVALLHYSPIKETILGEPDEIFPFLGSSHLAEPLDRREVNIAFHGHAHYGSLEGVTPGGVKVVNVSKTVLEKAGYSPPYYLMEFEPESVKHTEQG